MRTVIWVAKVVCEWRDKQNLKENAKRYDKWDIEQKDDVKYTK